MSISDSLVAQLRRRIFDERVGRAALRFACVDEAATDCLIAITAAKHLTTNVLNGRTAKALDVDLRSQKLDTVKLLAEFLQAQPGYQVITEPDFEPGHPSADLEVVGSLSILGQAVPLKHHLFSDKELEEVLANAVRRHNLSYTIETVPLNEQVFVLMLAHVEVNRILAGDSARRRNIEMSVDKLLEVADSIEKSYLGDIQRQQRAVPVPTFDEGDVGQGDVVVGNFSRRSPRNGFWAPMSSKGVLQAPELFPFSPDDVEDTKITVHWKRNRDERFYAYELYRDTVPQVERPPSLVALPQGPETLRQSVKRPFTAKLVFRSFGSHSNKDNVGWATFVEQAGQLITDFVDIGTGDLPPSGARQVAGADTAPPIEPETTYYYRLYIITLNYEVAGSNVISAKTRTLRALMDPFTGSGPLVPSSGAAGDIIALKGQRFHTGMTLTVGGKPVTLTILDTENATFPAPTFSNPAAANTLYDVVLTSTNGLKDVFAQGFRYLVP